MVKLSVILTTGICLVFGGCRGSQEAYRLKVGSEPYQLAESLSGVLPALDPEKNALLATTDNFSISSAELITVIVQSLGHKSNQLKSLSEERLKSIILQNIERLAEKKIILAEAEQAGLRTTEAAIDSVLSVLFAQLGGEAPYIAYLAQSGLQMEHIKRDIRQGLLIDTYVDEIVGKNIHITEDELKSRYSSLCESSQKASVRHILLITQGKSIVEKKPVYSRMQSLLKRARGGEDFARLAEAFSEDPGSNTNGGLYENFGRGEMVKAFDEAAFSIPVGAVSDIIETEYGYHILKVENREGETRGFEEVRPELYESLMIDKKNLAYSTHLQELKSACHLKLADL